MLPSYTTTKDFNSEYKISVVAVQTGSVTIRYLNSEGGTVIATAGTVAAGEVKAITQGKFALRVEVSGTTSYVIG